MWNDPKPAKKYPKPPTKYIKDTETSHKCY